MEMMVRDICFLQVGSGRNKAPLPPDEVKDNPRQERAALLLDRMQPSSRATSRLAGRNQTADRTFRHPSRSLRRLFNPEVPVCPYLRCVSDWLSPGLV